MRPNTFIYFIAPKDRSFVKIGCSYLPKNRLEIMIGWCPFPLEVVAMAPGTQVDERAIHNRFALLHSHREWFKSSPELLALIRTVELTGQIPEEFKAQTGERYPSVTITPEKRKRSPEKREQMSRIHKQRWEGIRASRALWSEIDQFLIESGMPFSDLLKAMGWTPKFVNHWRDDHPSFASTYGEKVRAFITAHKTALNQENTGTA